ncbi:MAG: site-specific integrase [Pseudomonadota bacterium]|nr:site-specific integrase [Pseudomonadota bacterium]
MLRVFPTGEKSFVYRYQIGGVRRSLTLGAYPAVDLAEAHRRYEAARYHVQEGRDPAHVKRQSQIAESAAVTVKAIVDEWQTLYANNHRKRPAEAQALLAKNLTAQFLAMKAKEVTKRDVVAVLDPILHRGSPAIATDVGSLLKQIFAYAVDRDRISASPLVTLKKHGGKEKKRKRWLTDEEIRIFWHKLDQCAMQEFMRIALRFALVTAQRRVEIASMRWAQIDFVNNIWSIPNTVAKNEEFHMVPLSPLALKLLAQLKVFAKDSEFVLPSYHRNKKSFRPLTERALTRAVADNEGVFGIAHFRPHDLRRTARTNMGRMKVPLQVAELVLNHKKEGVIEVYDQWEYLDEKRDALNKWAAHLEGIISQ